jgi:hypothetical protein
MTKTRIKMVSKIFKLLMSVVTGFILIILIFAYYPFVVSAFAKPTVGNYPVSYSLVLDSDRHYFQTLNNCGSYAVSGIINTLVSNNIKNQNDKGVKEFINPESVVKNMTFRFPDRFTLPLGIETHLKKQGLQIEQNNILALNNQEKVDYLKYHLSQGKPILIIIKDLQSPWYYLHYISVIGYDEQNFFIYDSLIKGDNNGDKTGNISIPKDKLIDMWNSGNILQYPKNYHLIVGEK